MSLSIARLAKSFLQSWYTPSRFLWRLPSSQPVVALTFDDGPDPVYTPALLDVLRRHGVVATFFVIGDKAAQQPALMRRIADEGHALAGHAMHHDEIPKRSASDLAADLGQCRQVIRDTSGADTVLFRPPRGRVDLPSIRRVCGLGYCLVHWSRTYSDYQRDGLQPLLERFTANPPLPGDIILLHDHNAFTIEALDTLLPRWQAAALRFVPIPQAGALRQRSTG